MKTKPHLAGLFSRWIPGPGKICAGLASKSAALLAAAVLIGRLNIHIPPVFAVPDPHFGGGWGFPGSAGRS